MGDQLGPGVTSIKECTSWSFTDLPEVEGFDEPGAGVFGLLLLKEGHYLRTPIQPAEPEWVVKLCMKQPHIILRGASLSHLSNVGRMLVSYAPEKPQRALHLRVKADANVNDS